MKEKEFSTETGSQKSKWFGKCLICKTPDVSLSTTKVSTGINMNYTIIKSCDRCTKKIHDIVEIILTALWRKE
jgi:hypothetical protein